MGDDSKSLHMEDDEARDLAEQPENKQGSDKRAPDRQQGKSVPEGGDDLSNPTGGSSGSGGGAGGAPAQDGADVGGASYGGGTGN